LSAIGEVGQFFDRALATSDETIALSRPVHELAHKETPEAALLVLGSFAETARLLGERTAELHLTLASEEDDPAFRPEPFSTLYQRSIYQSMRTLTGETAQALRRACVTQEAREECRRVADMETVLLSRFRRLVAGKINATRTRTHGNYHLGQVQLAGGEALITGFGGIPGRPASERRIKRSPLRDVANMLVSFGYATASALLDQRTGHFVRPEDLPRLQPQAQLWSRWAGATFLRAYLEKADGASFLPASQEDLALLLEVFVLETLVRDTWQLLARRPELVRIPLMGILEFKEGGLITGAA
jgi:maltose alpha-D-glucosyltransferase/alpha-amylase